MNRTGNGKGTPTTSFWKSNIVLSCFALAATIAAHWTGSLLRPKLSSPLQSPIKIERSNDTFESNGNRQVFLQFQASMESGAFESLSSAEKSVSGIAKEWGLVLLGNLSCTSQANQVLWRCFALQRRGAFVSYIWPSSGSVVMDFYLSGDEASLPTDVVEALIARHFALTTNPKTMASLDMIRGFAPREDSTLTGQRRRMTVAQEDFFEAFVHPAMLTHPQPAKVAVIADQVNGILREVLKHASVSDCVVFGAVAEQLRDSRVKILDTDVHLWFHRNSNEKNRILFDVVIVDKDFLVASAGHDFIRAMRASMNDEAVLVAEMGDAPTVKKAWRDSEIHVSLLDMLQDAGFEYVSDYSETATGRGNPQAFRVAITSFSIKNYWKRNAAIFDISVAERLSDDSLKFMDGASHMRLQFPSRIVQDLYCRSDIYDDEDEEECKPGFDAQLEHAPVTSFEVGPSLLPNAGRGVFAKHPIIEGSYMTIDESVHSMWIFGESFILMDNFIHAESEYQEVFQSLYYYAVGYGVTHNLFGLDVCYIVDPGIMTFANHGCNGTFNIGVPLEVTEMTADPDTPPDNEDDRTFYFYNPYLDRNVYKEAGSSDRFVKSVDEGEEVLDNYLVVADEEEWKKHVEELKDQCGNQAIVAESVTNYEARQ